MSHPFIIVFGVSGAGKSTICKLISDALTIPFLDADDFHPQANIQKMTSGNPLTDEDRIPWLKAVNAELHQNKETGFVLACSALKEEYRKILEVGISDINWVYLKGNFELIFSRLQARRNHFMNPDLLQDQFDTLEIPEYGFTVSIEYPPDEIVQKIINYLSE